MAPRARVTPHLLDEAAELLAETARAARLLVALDFDGTLAPIAPTPESATIDDAARTALAALSRLSRPATEVAVVSGRRAAELHALAPGADLYIGLHGLEIEAPPSPPRLRGDVAASDAALARLRPLLAPLRARGGRLEDKEHTIALHVRGLDTSLAAALVAEFAALVEAEGRRGTSLECLRGKAIAEARPRSARKPLAIAELVASRPGAALFFAGDDVTDEEVFAAFPDALTVAVLDEPRRTAARTWVRSPRELARALTVIAERR